MKPTHIEDYLVTVMMAVQNLQKKSVQMDLLHYKLLGIQKMIHISHNVKQSIQVLKISLIRSIIMV